MAASGLASPPSTLVQLSGSSFGGMPSANLDSSTQLAYLKEDDSLLRQVRTNV